MKGTRAVISSLFARYAGIKAVHDKLIIVKADAQSLTPSVFSPLFSNSKFFRTRPQYLEYMPCSPLLPKFTLLKLKS